MSVKLDPEQREAVDRMRNGCVLCGDVGSGKSRTSLAYYWLTEVGSTLRWTGKENRTPVDLYIITTAKKRDSLEWEGELADFAVSTDPKCSILKNKIVVDSWNNISKYSDVTGAFFLFDEQHVVGKGAWVKSFLRIAKVNHWVLLTATPGDTWQDYIPLFLANGFFKTRGEFNRAHIVYNPRCRFPKVDRYLDTERLVRLRDRILVQMEYTSKNEPHHEEVTVSYDRLKYKTAMRMRWDPYRNEPVKDAGGLCYLLRRIVNEDESRQAAVLEIMEEHPRVIIFYNFDYELEILRELGYGPEVEIAEWNSHKHQPIPETESWVYLVQYTAGCEGWNCVRTNCVMFYSQNYSWKVVKQTAGRIDRRNTLYSDLYYYHLKSQAPIDRAIGRALAEKRVFSENRFTRRTWQTSERRAA